MRKKNLLLGGAFVALLGLSACSNPEAEGRAAAPEVDTSGVEVVQEIADMVPEDMRERGSFTVGNTSTNLPTQYTDDDGELVGSQIDLFRAVATVMDLEAEFETVTFDALQPGIESGRFDVATVADLPDRHARLDIIDTFQNGASLIAHTSFEADEWDVENLCGRSVATTKGTGAENDLIERSATCEADGDPAIDISSYSDLAGVVLAVSSQQNELGYLEAVVGKAYAAEDPENLKVVYSNTLFITGMGVEKSNTEFRDALQAALQHLEEIGVYQEILDSYGIGDATTPGFPINQG